jgi:4-amino-4-deoxy-L-arabinose transferase-like glycosyltransferase
MLLGNIFWREAYTGDEGFYGVTAKNMLHAADYWVRPTYYPLGDFLTDRDGFAHPPFNSYFYAVALWLSGGRIAGPEILNGLNFAALLWIGYRLLRKTDRLAAKCSVLLLAASPAMLGYYSMLEAEPLLTTFGIAAVACALNGGWARGERRWVFASGLCLGLSFALKLWLCGPLALAVAAIIAVRAWERNRTSLGAVVLEGAKVTALFALGFVLPTATHLTAIALTHPEDLGFWLKNIYFGIITHSGISGEKFGGTATPTEWVHPIWYYGAALYRDHFFLVPIVLFGARPLWDEMTTKNAEANALTSRGNYDRALLIALAVGLSGLVPLSLMKVKEPLYVLTCAALLYFVAGLCLAALLRRLATEEGVDPLTRWIASALTIGLLAVFPFAYSRGIQPDKITAPFITAHTLLFVAMLGLILARRRRSVPRSFREVLAAGLVAIVVTSAVSFASRAPRDPMIVEKLQPYLDKNPAGELSFVGSNFKCYQYYTFHRGCYWHELPDASPAAVMQQMPYRQVRAFILDPSDLKRPHVADWVTWLQQNAVEKTPELDHALGKHSGFRLWVREPVAH